MNSLQNKVNSMYNGNVEAILSGISSQNEYLIMNAIICGAKMKLNDKNFMAGLEKAQNSDAVILGYPLKSVAEAATHYVIGKKYNGNNEVVKTLIKSEFKS